MFKLLLLFAYAVALSAQYRTCCEEGVLQVDSYECLNSVTNVSTPVEFSCNLKEHLTDDEVDIEDTLQMMKKTAEPDSAYCVANATNESDTRTLVVCQAVQFEPLIDDYILGICMFVSVGFLIPTILIYALLPEMRDLQGRSILHFCINLALALLLLGIIKIHESPTFVICGIRMFLDYYFLMATFFWMNAISIQILLNLSRPMTSDHRWSKFMWNALYAYGMPALLTLIMAIVNFAPGDHEKPGIGISHCFIKNEVQKWIYMYSVMAIIVLINSIIFVYLAYILWNSKFSSNHSKALKYKLRMTFRLLIIMGLPWIFEMISSLSPPHIIWVITDLFNVLQGPLIFLLLVVLRRRVVKALYKRGCLDWMGGPVERCLAVVDDEEDVVEHTAADGLDLTVS